MLDFPRWKVIWIYFVLTVGVLLAIPSLIGETNANKVGLGFMPRISLGLDLAGGSHILLEADVNEVARTRLAAMEDSIRSDMRRATPKIEIGDISTTEGSLSFMVRNPAQLDAAVDKARAQTSGIVATGQRDWDVAVRDGNRVVIIPTRDGLNSFVDEAMKGAVDVVRKRIDALGTREPTIVRQGSNRISVDVPGFGDPKQLKELIGRTAKLEFKLVDQNASQAQLAAGRAPVGSQVLRYENGAPIAVQRRAIITGSQLVKASQSYDQNNQAVVWITFNSEGGYKFAQVTKANVDKPFAIILDDKVISAPNINELILGGSAQISGNFTVESAQQLAIALQSGSLPVTLKVVEERTVGPDLGKESIRKGVTASILAAVLVILFMLVTYGRFGIYANIAVVLNILIIIGALSLIGSALTLPGIAGFVLTIGTAVDANVLINERIREELRRGRNVVMAVELGYKEASRTIFEANAVHTISGVIMLILGQGPVKGFAVVLLLGIATSVFTAVTFTRMLTAGYIRRHRPATLHI